MSTIWDHSGDHSLLIKPGYLIDSVPESEIWATLPMYVVSGKLGGALTEARFTGFSCKPLKTRASKFFRRFNPGTKAPSGFLWLQINGIPGKDDFGIDDDLHLIVSKTVVEVIKRINRGQFSIRPRPSRSR